MKNNLLHIITALTLCGLLLLLTDPFMFWMPPAAAMAALLLVAVLLCVWAGFVMYERVEDERDVLNRMHAGRTAYLAGVVVLTVGLLWQGFNQHIDPWIALALGTMVLAKLAAGLYANHYK